jgi:hypothetical protein
MSTIRERDAEWRQVPISANAVGAEPDRRDLLLALDALVAAAGPVLAVAGISYDGDSWYCTDVGIYDAEERMDRLRAVLAAAKEVTDGA